MTISVGGVAVAVTTAPDLVELVTCRFGSDPTDRPTDVTLSVGHEAPPLPDRPPDAVGRDAELWWDTDSSWFGAGGVTARAGPGSATVGIGRDSHGDVADSVELLEQYAVGMAIVTTDRMLAHGASVGRGGEAILVIGSSGRGKSTVAAAALGDGWDLLGDDMAVVRSGAANGRPTVHGVKRPPMVPADMVADRLDGRPVAGDSRGRWSLPPTVLAGGSRSLVGVVVVEHGDGDGSVERLTTPEQMASAIEGMAVPPAANVIRAHLPMLAELGALTTLRLRLGNPTLDGRPQIAALLDACWSAIDSD